RWPIIYPWQDRPNKALLTDFCESTFKNSGLSKGNAWFPQVAMHTLYCIEAKKGLKDDGRARITRRQRRRPCLTYAVHGVPPLGKNDGCASLNGPLHALRRPQLSQSAARKRPYME